MRCESKHFHTNYIHTVAITHSPDCQCVLFDPGHVTLRLTLAEQQMPLHKLHDVLLLFAVLTIMSIVHLQVSTTKISSAQIAESVCKLCTSVFVGHIVLDIRKKEVEKIRLLGEVKVGHTRSYVIGMCHEEHG